MALTNPDTVGGRSHYFTDKEIPMDAKLIEKMYRWNSRDLTPKLILRGRSRLAFLKEKELVKTKMTFIEKENVWHCLMWVYSKSGKKFKCSIIARKASSKEEARLKCALAAPIRAWKLK